MMGGITIKTPEQAQVYSEMLKEPVELGQHIEEPTCVSEDHPLWMAAIADGRDCPRVDLDWDNALPFTLLLQEASDHTRGMFDSYFRAAAGHLSAEEQLAILDRVHAGLMSDAVIAKLAPKPAERSDGR